MEAGRKLGVAAAAVLMGGGIIATQDPVLGLLQAHAQLVVGGVCSFLAWYVDATSACVVPLLRHQRFGGM